MAAAKWVCWAQLANAADGGLRTGSRNAFDVFEKQGSAVIELVLRCGINTPHGMRAGLSISEP